MYAFGAYLSKLGWGYFSRCSGFIAAFIVNFGAYGSLTLGAYLDMLGWGYSSRCSGFIASLSIYLGVSAVEETQFPIKIYLYKSNILTAILILQIHRIIVSFDNSLIIQLIGRNLSEISNFNMSIF